MLRFKKIIITLTVLLLSQLTGAQEAIRWKFQTGDRIQGSPIIHDNMILFGSKDHFFYALNVNNGELIWKFETENPVMSTPAIYENIICFESGNQLYGLDFNGNQVEGYFEFIARARGGRIISPFPFDDESTFWENNYLYDRKWFTRGSDDTQVLLRTLTGRVELRR